LGCECLLREMLQNLPRPRQVRAHSRAAPSSDPIEPFRASLPAQRDRSGPPRQIQ
jgi:hypothetical protein